MFWHGITTLALAAPLLAATPDWFDGTYNQALREARMSERPVLLAFVSPDSDYSRALEQESLTADALAESLSGYLLLRVDTSTPEGRQVVGLHNVADVPSLLFLDAQGRPEELIAGFIPAENLAYELQRVAEADQTVSMYRDAVAADGHDLQARFDLANKLRWVGDQRGYEREIEGLRAADPQHLSGPGATLHLYDLMWEVIGQEQDGQGFDPAPVADFLEGTSHDAVCFQGWSWVAASWREREQPGPALDASRRAFLHVSDDGGAAQWCGQLAEELVGRGDVLDADERAFAVRVAAKAVQGACGRAPQCTAEGELIEGAGAALLAAQADSDDGDDGKDGGGDGEAYRQRVASFVKLLGQAQALAGESEHARAAFLRCQELDPEHGEHYAEALASLAPPKRGRRR